MNNGLKKLCLVGLCVVLALGSGCRGYRTEKEPFHLNPNLDWQAKYKAQTLPLAHPEGTVAYGPGVAGATDEERAEYLKADPVFYQGKTDGGQWVSHAPVQVTDVLIKRGQERFNIYCSVCHDKTGSGKGMVVQRGFLPPPNLSDPRIRAYTDGQIFDIISHGIRNMPAYNKQIPEKDRWAIVVYLRALQRSQAEFVAPAPATGSSNATAGSDAKPEKHKKKSKNESHKEEKAK